MWEPTAVGEWLSISSALPGAPPARYWLEHSSWLFPSPSASRLLLLIDCVPLVLFGLRARTPSVGILLSFGIGWFTLVGAAMLLTDFYAGLLAFHLLVTAGALILLRQHRWIGPGLLVVSLLLGLIT